MSELILLAGLPGCGKTTYLAKLAQDGWAVFDDFKSGSLNSSPQFSHAKRLAEFGDAVESRKNVIVSDVDFCKQASREDADLFIRVRNRQRPSLNEDLAKLNHYASLYRIPEGVIVLPLGGLKLKISIDYDGTLWSHMAFFRNFMWAMKTAGHEVGCLTGHNEECRQPDIDLMVARGFPPPDFWFGRTPEYVPKNGSIYKAMVILREGIDIHFDDSDYGNPESLRHFKEGLGDQFYRVMSVQHREPTSVHYE